MTNYEKKHTRLVVSRLAQCADCDWMEEGNNSDTMKLSMRHAKKLKHCVRVEVARVYVYDERTKP